MMEQMWIKTEDARVGDVVVGHKDRYDTIHTQKTGKVISVGKTGRDIMTKDARYLVTYEPMLLVQREVAPAATLAAPQVGKVLNALQAKQLKDLEADLTKDIYDALRAKQPTPEVTYNGLTAMQCYERYVAGMQKDEYHGLVDSQLKAAREMWSTLLKAKRQAAEAEAREREVTVVMEAEDE